MPKKGWRYVTGDPDARRPPELLTRDHVARKIVKEVQEVEKPARGAAFLDIAWIKEHIKDSEGHIKKSSQACTISLKSWQAADITKEQMELARPRTMPWVGLR